MAQSVTIYSTPTCPYCKMAKTYFGEHDVAFTEVDVSENAQAQEEMFKKSQQFGVPVIDIDGTIIVGFDKPKIAEALGIKE